MSQDQSFILESSLGGPVSWVGRVSEDLQGRANRISQADGVSDIVPACWFCDSVGGGSRKGTMVSAHLDARQFSSCMPWVPFELLPQ